MCHYSDSEPDDDEHQVDWPHGENDMTQLLKKSKDAGYAMANQNDCNRMLVHQIPKDQYDHFHRTVGRNTTSKYYENMTTDN